jgi:MFS family permease
MNGELTVLGECLLLAITLLYSTIAVMIGRRAPSPASVAVYGVAVAAWVAFPLLSEANVHHVDRVVGIVGVGLLLVHVAFMALFCALLLTVVLATHQWSWRHQLALGGACVLTAVFVLLWLYVKTLDLPERGSVFYGIRAGHPPAVLWMNVSMGFGLLYIAAWNFVEFTHFLQKARTTYEQGYTAVSLVLYALSGVAGTLTMVEAVGRNRVLDMTAVPQAKAPLAILVIAATVGVSWCTKHGCGRSGGIGVSCSCVISGRN